MNMEGIEKEFEDIAKKSQPLFKELVIVEKTSHPLGIMKPRTREGIEILPELDINIDIITKITTLLTVHDILKEATYKYHTEKKPIYITIQKELKELSDIKSFENILAKLNRLLLEVNNKTYLYTSDIEEYNLKHPETTLIIELSNILQNIHKEAEEILQEYGIIPDTIKTKDGVEETRILYFTIKNARVINIEPYNLPKDIVDFINAFNEEVVSSEYSTYVNILYLKLDNKYRLDLTLGAAFDHRSLILYDPNPSIKTIDHIYVDGNYTRTVAWKKYLSDFSTSIEKEPIHILEKREEITKVLTEKGEEKELERALAWKSSMLKVKFPKEDTVNLVLIIYLINWDGVINHSSRIDVMKIEKEAEIIYYYGLYALYDENKKRYTVKYKREEQNIIRSAIRDTVSGIEDKLLPEY